MNDEGQEDFSFVHDLLGVYKSKLKVTFRSDIVKKGKGNIQLVNCFCRGRYKYHSG
jgi:hypothetical protein